MEWTLQVTRGWILQTQDFGKQDHSLSAEKAGRPVARTSKLAVSGMRGERSPNSIMTPSLKHTVKLNSPPSGLHRTSGTRGY